MSYECPVHKWSQFDHHDNHQCCQLTAQCRGPRRRRSTSRRYSQQSSWQSPPSHLHYTPSQYFDNEMEANEPSLRYGELEEEAIPDDSPLDTYYMSSGPIPSWSRSSRQFRQRPRLPVQSDYHYEYEDYYGDSVPARGCPFHNNNNKVNVAGRYFEPMDAADLSHHQSALQAYTTQQHHQRAPPVYKNHQPRHLRDLDFANYSDDNDNETDDFLDPNDRHQARSIATSGKKTPRRRHSLQHLHHHLRRSSLSINSPVMGSSPDASPMRPVLQPMLQTDAQRPLSFYGQAPPPHGLLMHPMPQPMIRPSSFLPYHSQPQPGYGAPTVSGMVPPLGSTTVPGSSMPLNPLMMMIPPTLADTQNMIGIPLHTDTQGETAMETSSVPAPPPSDNAKSLQAPLSDKHTSDTPATSSLSSSTSAPASTKHRIGVENALVPLVRSLSMGDSRSIDTKPRRRSLFESLFSLDGLKLSRSSSISSSSNTANDSISTPTTATSSSSLSSIIPIHELTTHTLTRKQSLSLEKNLKTLSQRSYIWCYQIKPIPGRQQQQYDDGCWVAMTPKNQTKLDPYICYYHPSAMVKGARTDNLSTLVTLEKEPKLSGSLTVMPQAKIARVYPSMFSSANYIELSIGCLPADSQFVVRSG